LFEKFEGIKNKEIIMKKLFFVISFLIFALLLSANVLEQFEEFKRDISRQTEQWQGTNQSNRNSRDYQIGDTFLFWSWNLTVMPPLWIQVPSTCKAVGDHCYIFVADDQWNVHMDQADIDIVLPYLEDYTMNSTEWGVIEMDETLFGPIPDELDNDPKIIVFYSELGSFMGTMFDGYFSAYNQVTEQQAQQMNPPGHSNECEMIYMTCYPLNPTDPIRISVLAHELQHMIHWLGDINEDTWVNEGCSELAMVYFGLPDPIVQFPNNPNNTLTFWDQEFADYVKVMLYFTYLEEQYDAVGDSLIKDIVSEPANSIAGITNQLIANGISQSFEDIFVDWTIANFLDDPEVENGLYYYENLDLPNFSAVYTHSVYPAGNNGSVNAWAADYIRLYPGDGDLELDLTTSFPIGLGVIRIGNEGVTSTVDKFVVSGTWNGVLPELTEDYSQMILVFSNNGYSDVTYTYSIVEVSILNPPTNVAVDGEIGTVYWDPPEMGLIRDLIGYNVYLDGIWQLAVGVDVFSYQYQYLIPGQTYIAGVSALYDEGESEIIEVEFIYSYVLFNPPQNLNVECIEDYAHFTWEAPAANLNHDDRKTKTNTEETRDLTGYNVYLDQVEVASNIPDLEYDFFGLVYGEYYDAGVKAIYDYGESELEEINFQYTGTGVGNILPLITELTGNYPNPFNPTTTIKFSLKEDCDVSINIYNIKGAIVRTLVDGEMSAAYHEIIWNGTDENNQPVSSGIYFYKLRSGDIEISKKMLLIK
jgi:hypothetical protein